MMLVLILFACGVGIGIGAVLVAIIRKIQKESERTDILYSASSERSVFCSACGSPLAENAAFCTACGKKVELPAGGAAAIGVTAGSSAGAAAAGMATGAVGGATAGGVPYGASVERLHVTGGMKVLCFVIPIVGLILYCSHVADSPQSAKTCLRFALGGLGFWIGVSVLLALLPYLVVYFAFR